ncbi:glycine-rich domain-containing protein [Shewanella cyperi]|uniref:glycine-rich domain-containing protein n=1 Tax=Shewanella cyperi TaxID=2814292 RepID=UPI001A948E95|nr:hypothetical protein [Shewanella cyperi]QSX40683.1 hypothetical protein JYB84_17335 [Shewanella cyperi]
MAGLFFACLAALPLLLVLRWRQRRKQRRERHIRELVFPDKLSHRLAERYPHLGQQGQLLVLEGLRNYFQLSLTAGRQPLAMPSQAVDCVWHEFILFTRQYQKFCRRAFGRFLHHTPAEAMQSQTSAQQGIRRCWRLACKAEGIDPKRPSRLPLLFALDSELQIADGFSYSLDCLRHPGSYCASHIACGTGCSSDSGCSDSGCSDNGCSSCSSGD